MYFTSKSGHLPFVDFPAARVPWWWTKVLVLEANMEGIREASAYDVDKMLPPRELWSPSKRDDLDEWYKEREAEKSERARKQRDSDILE